MEFLRFYKDEDDFERFRKNLKLLPCPHCKHVGSLICHGYLLGYPETGGNERDIRGHRIFCSNRHLRCGCGHTCSVLLCGLLKGFIVTVQTLWVFISAIVAGQTRKEAFTSLCPSMHCSAAYRLYHRLNRAQSGLRSRLLRHASVPPPPDSDHPFADTLAHFLAAFPKSRTSPFADYQLTFQDPLF